jgi:DNA mismatch endonuclease, patch repair protein
MSRQRTRDTTPELALRRELHRRGLRYRLQRKPIANLRRTVDIVFAGVRVAVDVRGCFWHGCTACKDTPKRNADWWAAKIESNRARDRQTAEVLRNAGWQVIVVWEHDACNDAADRVEDAVRAARGPRTIP